MSSAGTRNCNVAPQKADVFSLHKHDVASRRDEFTLGERAALKVVADEFSRYTGLQCCIADG